MSDIKELKLDEYDEIKYYQGKLSNLKDRYRVVIKDEKKRYYDKSFTLSKYKSNEEALKDAENFLKEKSDEVGLTKIQKVKRISPEMKQFFAGVFDGDGTIGLYESSLRTSVSQSSIDDNPPPLLVAFMNAYDGSICKYSRLREGKYGVHKPEYCFTLFGKECKPLLEVIETYGIIKAPQAKLALECLKRGTNRESSKKIFLSGDDKKFFVEAFSNEKKKYKDVPIDESKVTDAWIAGVFEAEGCVGYRNFDIDLYMTFTQHNCIAILHKINEKLGGSGNKIDSGQLTFCGKNMLPVINRIEHLLIGKKKQITNARLHLLSIASRKRKHRSLKDKKYDKEMKNQNRKAKRYKGGIEENKSNEEKNLSLIKVEKLY